MHLITTIIGCLSVSSALPHHEKLNLTTVHIPQAKRDLSLSYAATDYGSKGGTHVKTITVIKNVAGKKDKPLKIDPKLHKNENWGSYFRDNFNTYGIIPDVPDIDDLFEFVNKKENEKDKEKDKSTTTQQPEEKEQKNDDEEGKEEEKITENTTLATSEETPKESADDNVEKIHGDAELLQTGNHPGKVKSQSLDLGMYSVHEATADMDHVTSKHSNRKIFSNGHKHEKYIQSSSAPYFYQGPSRIPPNNLNIFASNANSITVTTPSGRKFDLPLYNSTDPNPYIAPNARKNQNPSIQQFGTSSQQPYIAPNLRKPYETQLNTTSSNSNSNCGPNATSVNQLPRINVYQNTRINSFSTNRPSFSRSRGLRY